MSSFEIGLTQSALQSIDCQTILSTARMHSRRLECRQSCSTHESDSMKIYVSGGTTTVRHLSTTRLGQEHLGHLLTPQMGNDIGSLIRSGLPWACDNSAFSNPDDTKFWNMAIDAWDWMRHCPPDWVAVPDSVCNHSETLRLFHDWVAMWNYELDTIPFPLAFVLQNGADIDSVPWDQIAAVFVGGDDDFKLNKCHDLVAYAKAIGKLVHVGRVNSLKRIKYAVDIGADSIDGSGFSMFPDRKIPRAIKEIGRLVSFRQLF